MDNVIRFDEYVFNAEVGELIRNDPQGIQTNIRLQPQPSKLLKLLLEQHPLIVTHDEIKQAIWPEVVVDFDGSMHYCIRQIRTALEDNATNPKFIETIPRRGYRWKAPILDSVAQTDTTQINHSMPANKSLRFFNSKMVAFLISLTLLFLVLFYFNTSSVSPNSPSLQKTRIAIMPLQPKESRHSYFQNNIAIQLVETLTNDQKSMEIIGPTTTTSYPLNNIRDAVLADKMDYVINARFYNVGAESRILIEIIRVSNGAHDWVKSYHANHNHNDVVNEVKTNLIKLIES